MPVKIPVGLEAELSLPDVLLLVSMPLLVVVGNELLMVPIFGVPGRTVVLSSCSAGNFRRLRRQPRRKVSVWKNQAGICGRRTKKGGGPRVGARRRSARGASKTQLPMVMLSTMMPVAPLVLSSTLMVRLYGPPVGALMFSVLLSIEK